MSYIPPLADNVNFDLSGTYTPPLGNDVDFFFTQGEDPGDIDTAPIITIVSVSRSKLFSNALRVGFDRTVVKWSSDSSGIYRIEIGGTGANTGTLFRSGRTFSDFVYRTVIRNNELEESGAFEGDGEYRFNIYAKKYNGDLWTPYVSE